MTSGSKASGQSGYEFEELLRAYFLRAGFFVVRGVPVRFAGDDATDIDIWLYERPTGTVRRRQGVDAKFKARPKAAERILWAKGLQIALGLDAAVVATTDKRASLRVLAKATGVTLFDGNDLNRIRNSPKVPYTERITEEEFLSLIRALDGSRRNHEFLDRLLDVKSSVSGNFGPALVNRALDAFSFFARECVTAHQDSAAAKTLGRLSLLSASLCAIGLDYVGSEEPFKSQAERHQTLLNVVRYGAPNREHGIEKLRLATALVRDYAPNGMAIASQMSSKMISDLDAIPAEIVADQAVKMTGENSLFAVARLLEMASYHQSVPNFDQLTHGCKSFLGALLDFSDVKRSSFASAWSASSAYVQSVTLEQSSSKEGPITDLFSI